jgi:WXG100 family type VII secretion target
MVTAGQQVETALGEVRADQTRLSGIHAELVGASWQGQSAAAFTNAYNRFNEDFQIVINAMNAMHEKLVGTSKNYNTVETANTQGINKLASVLNR